MEENIVMAKVKIISNPYESVIAYQKWDDDTKQWESMGESSKLHADKLTHAVFPFQAKKILDVINEEFRSGSDKIELWFEGTGDEYRDLQALCTEESYPNIALQELKRSLENARDILPGVKRIYDEKIQPLISASVSEDAELRQAKRQFSDVSREAIPICVLGTYSSGKSTFINALVGAEILPSGAKPLTARIHQIEDSRHSDRASVAFDYDGARMEIRFQGSEVRKLPDSSGSPLIDSLNAALAETETEPLTVRVNRLLAVLNNPDHPDHGLVSNLIEIRVPFNREGIFGRSANHYVVFDTPGSNSATNTSHAKVLREAMEDLSNGLPIYVSEFDDLDSTDNKALCAMIKNMKELDSRYTMIVVGRADEPDLLGLQDPAEEKAVLNQAIPLNIYSSGIYFAASIIGLGAKTNGKFRDANYGRIYRRAGDTFTNEASEDYRALYEFDILPEQIKQAAIDESKNYPNVILANSGLYWIEREIENFASKYSPYNKCKQSKLFLHKAIEITERKIEESKLSCEQEREHWEQLLKESERKLANDLNKKSDELQTSFRNDFSGAMESPKRELSPQLTVEMLLAEEERIAKTFREQDDTIADLEASVSAAKSDLFGRAKNLVSREKDRKIELNDVKHLGEQWGALRQAEKDLGERTADRLFEETKAHFDANIAQAQARLNQESKEYWTAGSEEIKRELVEIVTGSQALSEEKKEKLRETIMTFASISFDRKGDEIFVLERFTSWLSVLGLGNKLDKRKLQRTYVKEFKKAIDSIFDALNENHGKSFENWNTDLLSKIQENITDFNPELRKYRRIIDEKTELIKDLENRRIQLRQYTRQIEEMMEWHDSEE